MAWLVALAVVLALAALVVVPVRARVEFDSAAAGRRLTWQVRWLLLRFRSGGARRSRRRRPRPDRPARRPARGRGRQVSAALATPGVARRGMRLGRELLEALRPRALDAAVRFGLDDPASTGVLFGRVQALRAVMPAGWRVQVEPDFEDALLEGRWRAEWSVAPVSVIWPIATFLAAPVVWRAGLAAWKAGRRPPR